MKSLKQVYKCGYGPSSSHTMGPAKAAQSFLENYPNATNYKVVLYGSLAMTGKGHGTDLALQKVFGSRTVEIVFDKQTQTVHPNTMDFFAYYDATLIGQMQIISVGGGDIATSGKLPVGSEVYAENSFEEIKKCCKARNLRLWEYALEHESDVLQYTHEMWQKMQQAANRGLKAEGVLPGGLGVIRRAKTLWNNARKGETEQIRQDRIVAAYAFALGEENAAGGEIVTGPTCGSCGVVPAVFLYHKQQYGYTDDQIVKALVTAAIVGNVVKTNASVSGAECGCQAEVGTACAMAAAGLAELKGMSPDEIEYSAEVALEHHLGLTCDPVGGLVQIPCIERNAVAAMRAINAVNLASFLTDSRKISFDTVVATMYETGKDLAKSYRETSEGGLAKHFEKC